MHYIALSARTSHGIVSNLQVSHCKSITDEGTRVLAWLLRVSNEIYMPAQVSLS